MKISIYCRNLCLLGIFFGAACSTSMNGKIPADSNTEKAAESAGESPSTGSAQTAGPVSGTGRGYAAVRLGIRPGMAAAEEPGVLVQSVSIGTSAEKGGMLAGDLIVGWGGEDLIDVMDMVERLRSHSPGDEVPFVVIRDGEEVELMIVFQASDKTEPN